MEQHNSTVELVLLGSKDKPEYNSHLRVQKEDDKLMLKAFGEVLSELSEKKSYWRRSDNTCVHYFNITPQRAKFIHDNMQKIADTLHELTGAKEVTTISAKQMVLPTEDKTDAKTFDNINLN